MSIAYSDAEVIKVLEQAILAVCSSKHVMIGELQRLQTGFTRMIRKGGDDTQIYQAVNELLTRIIDMRK